MRISPNNEEAYQVLVQLYQYDRDIPLRSQVVEKDEDDVYIREKVVFYGTGDSLIPGYLGIPKTGSPPYPCVLQLHGFSAQKSQWWEEQGYGSCGLLTKNLLSAGIAVLALDAQYHGERISNNKYESPAVFVEQRKWANRYRDMFVQTVVEYRRAIDYLENRPEINTTQMGVIGYSMGGQMAFILTAVEGRVKATVLCVTPPIPSLVTYPVVLANFARGFGNRPLLLLMGRSDHTYTVEEAQRFYELIQDSSKELVLYNSGHNLSMDYIPKAVTWFQKHLC